MILLTIFAFLGGIVTILSPCILPILPIILSSSFGGVEEDRRKPLGIIFGFILSFTFFTLFLSTIVNLTGISAQALRNVSVFIIGFFGLSYLVPAFQKIIEKAFAKLSSLTPNTTGKTGFGAGVVIGLSLGLLWTPCVGPILASVISLAISGQVNFQAFILTLAYSIGTAIPMFAVMVTGRKIVEKIGNTQKIQKIFGVIMILTAIAIFFNWDRNFQSYILKKFPNYGTNLTKFEEMATTKQTPRPTNYAPELIPGGEWINSEPLTLESLRGQVVLVDFWTYTCINCQRTLPYIKDWYKKYKDQGFVVIGVHAPEFEFEKDITNVKKAVADFGLEYPIMQDNNFATWRAYNNHYWPAKYLINKNGQIVYTHFGEGDYDITEQRIQELLGVTGDVDNQTTLNYAKTPETYLGSLRAVPSTKLKLIGVWNQQPEYATPTKGSSLTYDFEAKNVFLVMAPEDEKTISKVKVYLDDVYQKEIEVDSDSLYTLIELQTPGKHQLKLEFEDGKVKLFAFTFG